MVDKCCKQFLLYSHGTFLYPSQKRTTSGLFSSGSSCPHCAEELIGVSLSSSLKYVWLLAVAFPSLCQNSPLFCFLSFYEKWTFNGPPLWGYLLGTSPWHKCFQIIVFLSGFLTSTCITEFSSKCFGCINLCFSVCCRASYYIWSHTTRLTNLIKECFHFIHLYHHLLLYHPM